MSIFSINDQIFFAQRLSLLLDSNISLIDSLNIIKSIDTSRNKKDIYRQIIDSCQKGISLSKSISISKAKFNFLLITLIKNGERSASLSISLYQASKILEKKNEFKKKIISILIYPVFILLATLFMALFLILYIFPKILPMLNSLNIKLPLMTIILREIYFFSISYGFIVLILLILVFVLFYFIYKKVNRAKIIFNKLLLNIPFIKNYIKLSISSSICNIGDTFLSSGNSLSDFNLFSIESINNILYKKAFNDIYNQSLQGISFSNSLLKYNNLFPKVMIDMCAIGEKTGNLSIMMNHISKIFDQDLDIFLKRFSSLIEPILMIIMGIVVGSIALSIILPIYEITNHLSK